MKKTLVFITALLLGLSSYSQIQRKFYDCTLGVSTRAQVKKTLEGKGFNVYEDDETLQINSAIFAGYEWNVAFIFFRDKLYYVFLQMRANYYNDLEYIYNDLSKKLLKKYNDYQITDEEYNIMFLDGITVCGLKYEKLRDEITFAYIDKELLNLVNKANENDL